ncbi:MAG: DUF4209 domain-containing protein [Flavobacteriales bacterium]|nr:DUF4209 domain-containing protein [Flavobacteriales bacterium]
MKFKTLEQFYIEVESITNSSTQRSQVISNLINIRESNFEKLDQDVLDKIQCEVACFQFVLLNGKAKSRVLFTEEDATEYGYPSTNLINDKMGDYIIERAISVQNTYLKIRYNQILWNDTKLKNRSHAQQAIDCYYKLTTEKNNDIDGDRQDYCFDYFKNGFYLAFSANYKTGDFKELWKQCIYDENIIEPWQKYNFIDFAVKSTKFKKSDFNGVIDLCLEIAENMKIPHDFFHKEAILLSGLEISKKGVDSSVKINEAIALNYEELAENRMDDASRIIPVKYFGKALMYYEDANNQVKIEEIALKIANLRNEQSLSYMQHRYDDDNSKALMNYLREKAKKVLELNPEEIFTYLANGDDREIFPDAEWVEESAKKNKNESFLDTIPPSYIDINNNQSQGSDSDEDIHLRKVFENYGWYIGFSVNPFLYFLFTGGVENGKLSFRSFIEFVRDRSWLAQFFNERHGGGEDSPHSWLSLIAPSIQEFFIQFESHVYEPKYNPGYILAIDSLAMKFEGILRTFAQFLNVKTVKYDRKIKGTREMFIEELLLDDKVQNHFNESDRLLFKYILLRNGMNIRNNIAHSFYRYSDYDLSKFLLIFLAVLRLGRYKITISKK